MSEHDRLGAPKFIVHSRRFDEEPNVFVIRADFPEEYLKISEKNNSAEISFGELESYVDFFPYVIGIIKLHREFIFKNKMKVRIELHEHFAEMLKSGKEAEDRGHD